MNVSADFGRFLYMCARARKAKRIVEFGTSFGISTIHLACALRDGGGGHLIGSDLEPTKARRPRENLNDAGLADLVEIRIGDALETFKDGIDGDVDLLFLDGAFSLYLPVLKLLEPYLRDGAFVIAVTQQIDLSGPVGHLIASLLFGIAEIELQHSKERQAVGIALAKKRGVYTGRRQGTTKATPARARALRKQKLTVAEIAQALGVKERSVYNYLNNGR